MRKFILRRSKPRIFAHGISQTQPGAGPVNPIDAKNKVGPALTGIIGAKAGAVEGYKYGKDLAAAGEAGLVWTEEEVFEYLKDPKKYLRAKLDNKKAKSKMSFKLKKEDQRLDVIAYLKTFSPAAEGEAAEEETTTTN